MESEIKSTTGIPHERITKDPAKIIRLLREVQTMRNFQRAVHADQQNIFTRDIRAVPTTAHYSHLQSMNDAQALVDAAILELTA